MTTKFHAAAARQVASKQLVITISLARVMLCIALVLLFRVLRMLRLARMHHAVSTLSGQKTPAVLACSAEPAARSSGTSDAGESTPTPSVSNTEPELSVPLELRGLVPPHWHTGANIDELLVTHSERVSQMLSQAAGCPGFRPGSSGPGAHDELFALRFLISHKLSVEKACDAMLATLEWRQRNKVDEIRTFVESAPQSAFPGHEHIDAFFPTPIVVPDGDWPPFMLINAERLNPKELMRHITIEQYVVYSMHMSELMAAACDAITRRTRRLTKAIRIVAMGGLSVKHASMGFARAASAAAKDHVDCYPQNLGYLFLCNVPFPMKVLWDKAIAPLLPDRVVEKTAVLNPRYELSDLDFLTTYVRLLDLPPCIFPATGANAKSTAASRLVRRISGRQSSRET